MAPRKIEFHPAALEEAEATRDWYSERSPAVARAFIRELLHAVEHVAAAPERWPLFTSDTRRYLSSQVSLQPHLSCRLGEYPDRLRGA